MLSELEKSLDDAEHVHLPEHDSLESSQQSFDAKKVVHEEPAPPSDQINAFATTTQHPQSILDQSFTSSSHESTDFHKEIEDELAAAAHFDAELPKENDKPLYHEPSDLLSLTSSSPHEPAEPFELHHSPQPQVNENVDLLSFSSSSQSTEPKEEKKSQLVDQKELEQSFSSSSQDSIEVPTIHTDESKNLEKVENLEESFASSFHDSIESPTVQKPKLEHSFASSSGSDEPFNLQRERDRKHSKEEPIMDPIYANLHKNIQLEQTNSTGLDETPIINQFIRIFKNLTIKIKHKLSRSNQLTY